jgi:hypothetical protein
MRLAWTIDGNTYRLRLRLDPWETLTATGQDRRTVSLLTHTCTVELPDVTREPHPDALALAAWTVAAPWTRDRVLFDRPISARLAEAIARGWKVEAGPVDDRADEREPGAVIGLSYSGGADSIAVSEMLPSGSPHIFFRRVRHGRVPNRARHMRADVAERLVRQAAGRGRNVAVVRSDLEYLTLPWPMFPAWTTLAIGCVLLADHYDLGAVGFGTVLESRYLANGYRYVSGGDGPWGAAFTAAGLPFFRPAAGLTEVVTIRLAAMSELADLARSCLLGDFSRPCSACAKCLRKELVAAGLERRPLDKRLLRNIGHEHRAVQNLLKAPPYYFQDVIEYGLARAVGVEGTVLRTALEHLRPTVEDTEWTTRFYPRALEDEVPAPWRERVSRFVEERVGFMTDDQVDTVETWDAAIRGKVVSAARPR